MRSPKWSRHKDRYIGILYLDIGMVPSGSGIFSEYREVTGTPREKLWALWAIRRKHTSPQGAGAPPLGRRLNWNRFGGAAPLPIRIGLGGRAPSLDPFPSFPLRPNKTPNTSVFVQTHSGPFRSPNIGFQYINLYVSIISRLLVMSVITLGTPNYLRYIKTHKLIIPIVIEC